MIDVIQIVDPADSEAAFAIRRQVFVEEQHVAPEEEFDEFESTSTHLLARVDGQPAGTARWRRTSKGIKLERFAVLPQFRGQGVGKALVGTMLNSVFSLMPEPIESIYLHAQLTAMPLYAGFGFVPTGPQFDECNIMHTKMVLPVSAYPKQ
ncbi:GNAT family N-acetyltransferase [Spirosoma luteolum]